MSPLNLLSPVSLTVKPPSSAHELMQSLGIHGGRQPDESQTEGTLVRSDALTFTIVSTSDGQPLAKRFWLNEAGALETQTVASLVRGEATVEYAGSITEFAERLQGLAPHQAILHGIPSVERAMVVTQREHDRMTPEERSGVITRTREHLQFAPAPGCVMLDFDASGAPPALLDVVASPEKSRALLIEAVPELEDAPMLWRPSSSSYLYDGTCEVQGLRGQRVYIPVTWASDIPSFGMLLYERLWLLGYGYIIVSASGQLLDRTLLDKSVWQPERLDFAAGPVCVPPLERRAPEATIWNGDATFFKVRRAANLTAQDQRLIEVKRKGARAAQRDVARIRREAWAQERGKHFAASGHLDEAVGVAVAKEAVDGQILRPGFLLQTDEGEVVNVEELLTHPETWHQRRFRDPLEPDYRDDDRIAWANLHPAHGRPYIYSHAHGGIRYELSKNRQTIQVEDGELPRIVDQCTDIIATEGQVYQYKDQIVRVTDHGRLAPVESEWIADWIQRRADVVKLKGTGLRRCDLPPKYANTILAKSGEIGLPNLLAITNGPFLRPDGSVVDEPGYDEATQVLYHQISPGVPSVRRVLTIPEAEEALRHLWDPFSKFPFAEDVDHGSVLALLLTAALRPGLATAPGGLVESHEAGSGKTLCAQAIANLTGVAAVPQALAAYEEEIRKGLFAAARAGTPSVLYDNVGRDRVVDSAALAMVLTSGTIADRVLGESTHATVPFRSLMLLTGNNPRIAGDLNRRLLRVSITPNVEYPWQRVFDFDPRARTEANWLNLRVAALELVQAALRDGASSLDGASGYPDWDRLVRRTVRWAAQRLDIGVRFVDPIQSVLSGYGEDPERDRLSRLLASWRQVLGDEPVTVKQVMDRIAAMPISGAECESNGTPEPLSELEDALGEIDPKRGSHAIGVYLNQQKGRIVENLVLVKAGKHNGSTQWAVRSGEAAI